MGQLGLLAEVASAMTNRIKSDRHVRVSPARVDEHRGSHQGVLGTTEVEPGSGLSASGLTVVRCKLRSPPRSGRFLDSSGGTCANNTDPLRGGPSRITLGQACGAGQQGTMPPDTGARASRLSGDPRHYSRIGIHGRAVWFETRTRPIGRLRSGQQI